MNKFIRICAVSMILGGLCIIITNCILSPFIDFTAPYSETAITTKFLYRMIFAALSVAFLLLGTVGIHVYQIEKSNNFGHITFVIVFFGCAFTLAHEWYQIFVMPDLASIDPEAVLDLNSTDGFIKYHIGTMIAIITFSVGWILFSISMLLNKVLNRMGSILVIAGFLLLPILSAITTPVWGGIIGTAVLGIAYILIGLELFRSKNLNTEIV